MSLFVYNSAHSGGDAFQGAPRRHGVGEDGCGGWAVAPKRTSHGAVPKEAGCVWMVPGQQPFDAKVLQRRVRCLLFSSFVCAHVDDGDENDSNSNSIQHVYSEVALLNGIDSVRGGKCGTVFLVCFYALL